MTGPVQTPPEFAQTLRDVLALPAEDQVRLCSVLERLTRLGPRELMLPPAPRPAEPAEDPSQEQQITEWLAQVRDLAPWHQLQLLDEALEAPDSPQEAALLQAARTDLLHAHPPLAVRRAVVALATRQPIATCVGSLGLVVGVIGIGRLLLRVMF